MEYRFVEKNGIRMIEVTPIVETGAAIAYCSTRNGGVSTGPTAHMNLNIYKRLDVENGQKNLKLFSKAIGTSYDRLITNRLIYGTDIVRRVTSADLIDIFDEPSAPHADGMVTDDPEITLYLYAADCAIIQFADPVRRVVGCCHAGWKGTMTDIMKNTAAAMHDDYGCEYENIIAVILPSICKDCFEVGEDVAEAFEKAGYGKYVDRSLEKPHVDLNAANAENLLNAGLRPENIHRIDLCTCCREDLFHSYRRGPVQENGLHLNGMNGMFIRVNPESTC